MKKNIFVLLLLFPLATIAQTITGKVVNTKNEPLNNATIKWLQTNVAKRTNAKGEFVIEKSATTNVLTVSHSGYKTDTINVLLDTVLLIKLKTSNTLQTVTVVAEKEGTLLSNRTPFN
jgi:hypothetical protein